MRYIIAILFFGLLSAADEQGPFMGIPSDGGVSMKFNSGVYSLEILGKDDKYHATDLLIFTGREIYGAQEYDGNKTIIYKPIVKYISSLGKGRNASEIVGIRQLITWAVSGRMDNYTIATTLFTWDGNLSAFVGSTIVISNGEVDGEKEKVRLQYKSTIEDGWYGAIYKYNARSN